MSSPSLRAKGVFPPLLPLLPLNFLLLQYDQFESNFLLVMSFLYACCPFPLESRQWYRQVLDSEELKTVPIMLRINGLDAQDELKKDIAELAHKRVRGLLLPKVASAADVSIFEDVARQMEQKASLPEGQLQLYPIIETASALEHVYSIAHASRRNAALFYGAEDLCLEMECSADEFRYSFYGRAAVVSAARAAQLSPIDTPFMRVPSYAGLLASCR